MTRESLLREIEFWLIAKTGIHVCSAAEIHYRATELQAGAALLWRSRLAMKWLASGNSTLPASFREDVLRLAQQFPEISRLISHLIQDLERNEESAVSPRADGLEARFIALLTERSRSREELKQDLYGSSLPWNHVEGRFRHLVCRVRKRYPGALIADGEFYRWSRSG